MRRYKDLRIATKLTWLTCFMATITLMVGWVGMSNASWLKEALDEVNTYNKQREIVESVQSYYVRCRANLLSYGIEKDESFEQKVVEHGKEMLDRMAEYIESIKNDSQAERDKAATLNQQLVDYQAFADRAINLIKMDQKNQAQELMVTEGVDRDHAIRENIDGINAIVDREIVEKNAMAARTFKEALTWIIIVGLIGISLSIGFGLFLSRLISIPLQKTTEVIMTMAKGDFSRDLQLEKSRDEVGQMAEELAKMNESLSHIIAGVLETAGHVENGSREIAAGNQDLSQRTQEQAATLEEIASTIDLISSTIRQSAESSFQADKLSQQTLGAVQEGEKSVEETIEAMRTITDSSNQIGEIIKVVNDIAFQTNLLALNAAVEAARAGEQGHGFAVVAAEVRSLAGRTAESSKEIEKLIKESVERVERGNLLVHRSGEMLRQIVNNTKRTSDVVVEITASLREQSTASEQIQKAVAQLNQVTQQNAAMVQEIAASSEGLNTEADRLTDMMSVFRVKEIKLDQGQDRRNVGGKRRNQLAQRDKSHKPWDFEDDEFNRF